MFDLVNLSLGPGVQLSKWRTSTSIKVTIILIFALALTISDILKCQMFDPENLGQRHRVQYSIFAVVSFGDECQTSIKVIAHVLL